MLIALTRPVSESIAHCELTHLHRQPIDIRKARDQHAAYEKCLEEIGCTLLRLPESAGLPDSVFVEDTAVVLDELAIIMRPGVASRRDETKSVAESLKRFRNLYYIAAPGTVDGGDVLRIGMKLYVGISGRSNKEGAEQMRTILKPYGYEIIEVAVNGCLHLKSAVTQVADSTVLINKDWVDYEIFNSNPCIEVDPSEPYAANALWLNGTVMYPASFPQTRKKLEEAGIQLRIVDASELAKAEGALTCCSIIFKT